MHGHELISLEMSRNGLNSFEFRCLQGFHEVNSQKEFKFWVDWQKKIKPDKGLATTPFSITGYRPSCELVLIFVFVFALKLFLDTSSVLVLLVNLSSVQADRAFQTRCVFSLQVGGGLPRFMVFTHKSEFEWVNSLIPNDLSHRQRHPPSQSHQRFPPTPPKSKEKATFHPPATSNSPSTPAEIAPRDHQAPCCPMPFTQSPTPCVMTFLNSGYTANPPRNISTHFQT